jgi:hypothetical protein
MYAATARFCMLNVYQSLAEQYRKFEIETEKEYRFDDE